jgi:acetylglutamate kinase
MTELAPSIRVIKVGGRPQGAADLAQRVANAWRATPSAVVLVHGGGDEISALQRAFATTPQFIGGRRVTSDADIDVLRMALSGAANKRLVARLRAVGIDAVGLSGEDGALIEATELDAHIYGRVGTPARVNVALLQLLLGGGHLPVISPVSASERAGETLNVNGDDAAAAIAAALRAGELLLIADVPGVLVNGSVAPALDRAAAEALVTDGIAAGGMGAKVQAALVALASGVSRVRIGDLTAIDDASAGTLFVTTRDQGIATISSIATNDRSYA